MGYPQAQVEILDVGPPHEVRIAAAENVARALKDMAQRVARMVEKTKAAADDRSHE